MWVRERGPQPIAGLLKLAVHLHEVLLVEARPAAQVVLPVPQRFAVAQHLTSFTAPPLPTTNDCSLNARYRSSSVVKMFSIALDALVSFKLMMLISSP